MQELLEAGDAVLPHLPAPTKLSLLTVARSQARTPLLLMALQASGLKIGRTGASTPVSEGVQGSRIVDKLLLDHSTPVIRLRLQCLTCLTWNHQHHFKLAELGKVIEE